LEKKTRRKSAKRISQKKGKGFAEWKEKMIHGKGKREPNVEKEKSLHEERKKGSNFSQRASSQKKKSSVRKNRYDSTRGQVSRGRVNLL